MLVFISGSGLLIFFNSDYNSSNNIFSDSHNPDRVIFNFSSYELTDEEKNVLCKGLNFSVKPGWIEYSEGTRCLINLLQLFHEIPRNETHCGCCFIAVILTEMKFISGGKVLYKHYYVIKSYENKHMGRQI